MMLKLQLQSKKVTNRFESNLMACEPSETTHLYEIILKRHPVIFSLRKSCGYIFTDLGKPDQARF